MSEPNVAPKGLRFAVDYGPLLVFFIAYYTAGIMWATGAIMVATAVMLSISWYFERRLPPVPLVTAILVVVFGGLTLLLADETFIKMKPTIVKAFIAAVLLGGLVFGRPLLKPLFGAVWKIDDDGWRKLTLRFGLFFVAMAVLNEIVWRTQSTDFWVNYKLFGTIGLTFAFSLTQIHVFRRHWIDEPTESG